MQPVPLIIFIHAQDKLTFHSFIICYIFYFQSTSIFFKGTDLFISCNEGLILSRRKSKFGALIKTKWLGFPSSSYSGMFVLLKKKFCAILKWLLSTYHDLVSLGLGYNVKSWPIMSAIAKVTASGPTSAIIFFKHVKKRFQDHVFAFQQSSVYGIEHCWIANSWIAKITAWRVSQNC